MNTLIVFILIAVGATAVQAQNETYELNDSHFHLTNYIQEGTALQEFVRIMGDKVGRLRYSAYRFSSSSGRIASMVTGRRLTT
jgi:hypothetical protein